MLKFNFLIFRHSILSILPAFILVGCATTPPLSAQVTEAERQAVYADLRQKRSYLTEKQARVDAIGKKLTAFNLNNAAKDIQFKVGGAFSGVNAYTDNNRHVYISPEMMRFVRSDDELAFVLSHEIGHILKGHHPRRRLEGMLSGATAIMAGTYAEQKVKGSGSLAANAVDRVILSPFSKEMEWEADEIALTYMKHAGYELNAAPAVLRRFGVEIPVSQDTSFVSTHPASSERFARLGALIKNGEVHEN